MRSLPLMFVSLLTSAFVASACDDGNAPADPDPTTATTATTAPTTETPDVVEPEPDVPVEEHPEYPAGPYGAEYLDTIKDMGFYDPWTGITTKFSDFIGSDTKVLLVVSGAGWCTACQYESWDLWETYDKYADDGLEILYTLYEDTQGKQIWRDGADAEEIDADFTFMNDWKDNLGAWVGLEPRVANYPTLVDVGFTLGEYYNKAATPLSLIVRVSDMKILYREIGYSAGAVQTIIKQVMFQ